jgi:membrane protein DedA with SNARE-associated domain
MLTALELALTGQGGPWLIAIALALTTLLLEDVAIAAGVAVAAQGALSWAASLSAVALGIALGDLALYGLGLAAHRVGWIRRRYIERPNCAPGTESAVTRWRGQLTTRLGAAVVLARIIPGLRLLTYTACGFLRVAWWPFFGWVVLAVCAWTLALYALSWWIGEWITRQTGLSLPVAVALPALVLALAVPGWRYAARRIRKQVQPSLS